MNPIRSFEAAITKVWKSDLPTEAKIVNLKKVEDSIHHYVSRAETKADKGVDPLSVCARKRALGYLELLANDCAYLAESCRNGASQLTSAGKR
jgi:hypothetical protein